MDSIMSLLPNDIIINILKERRIMKQCDKYKKNYNFVLKEIIKHDKKCWGNLIKYYYEKRRNNGSKIIREIKYSKFMIKQNKQIVLEELNDIFANPFSSIRDMLNYIDIATHDIFVETSSDED